MVIQADNLGTGLSQTIVAMITSKIGRARHPSRVLIEISTPLGQQTGLLSDSVIMTDNLATVLDTEIDRSIGVLADMSSVEVALRHTLGI